ncbi:2-oxo acid dehydrogenase subunit E2 [Candidatus Haliotispira prima]|uniref:Dihydrolipoamide acetyltransferase component of pyruvate dehydrogenase complex n=1 Tax=Candidatus Haliotispira prima TaxID=3034016 RepID=A0ABY8MK74_9SPIO|nr:2-oxo acid dehydrogenase subunit E2 [Candidatus Haliotispira prima]
MANVIDIVVPDGVSDAAVVEIMQQTGAVVAEEESLLAVETDKATAEIPSPAAGKLLELSVKEGDTVSGGDVIGRLEAESSAGADTVSDQIAVPVRVPAPEENLGLMDIVVPDGVTDAAVVEIMQDVGAEVAEDDSLIAVETDKATAEIPAPAAGKLLELSVGTGDTVSGGDIIGKLQVVGAAGSAGAAASESSELSQSSKTPKPDRVEVPVSVADVAAPAGAVLTNTQNPGGSVHASPSVRQFARELGVDIRRISHTTGPKGRITFTDVRNLVKSVMSGSAGTEGTNSITGGGIPRIELPDFTKFGSTEEFALSKIKQITGKHLSKGWLNIPLVTHFEETDITELEDFRKELNNRKAVGKDKDGLPKTTALAFIVKAVVKALQQYPQVNSSLGGDGKSLIIKKYYNIGIAVDTPRGLIVPVIKNADQLSLDEISAYIRELGLKGRSGKLVPADMEGGSFTVSSLGGLGGTNFTPLVNPPEAAILGVAKAAMKPVWNGKEFLPRLILPFSVSYDHRVLDGGEVARFGSTLAGFLRDLRYMLV